MSPNANNLISYSGYSAFKNNTVYSGSFVIGGTTSAGTNIQTDVMTLATAPDMVDIVFNGPANSNTTVDPRPVTAWFKNSSSYTQTNRVWVPTDNAGGGNPSGWSLYGTVVGTKLTITAIYVQGFTAPEVLTNTIAYYRLIDYSVF